MELVAPPLSAMLRFVIFVCNYPGGAHVAAAIWPCTCLLLPEWHCFRVR